MRRTTLYLILILLVVPLFGSFDIAINPKPVKEFVVVLDAGHGGHDPGNLGNGYLEKNIALNIVLQVGAELQKIPGVKVIYTRDDDTFVDLYVRGEIANKANADLFVSVHCDSHTSNAHGAGTFVLGLHANEQNFAIAKKENSVIYLENDYQTRYAEYDINSPESVIGLTIMQEEFLDQSINLARMMQDNFTKKLKRTDRKVKQAGFIVLHQTFMPSVLVETGFLTNKEEGAYLNSKKGQSEMGKAIAQAILTYKQEITGSEEIIEPLQENEAPTVVNTPKETPKAAEPVKEEPVKAEVAEKTVEEIKQPEKENAVTEPVVEKTIETTKEVVQKEAPKKEEKSNVAEDVKIEFRVQIMASGKNIALNPDNFKGLNTLTKESYKNLYRYMYGSTDSYFQATLLKSNADAKGYTQSYIVAYKNGERISLDEAKKYVSE